MILKSISKNQYSLIKYVNFRPLASILTTPTTMTTMIINPTSTLRCYHVETKSKHVQSKSTYLQNQLNQCPGCGSQFQSKDNLKAGYYNEQEVESKKSISNYQKGSKSLSRDEIQILLSTSQLDFNLSEMELAPDNLLAFEKNNLPTPIDLKKTKTKYCQRCYYLNNHNKLQTSWKNNSVIDMSYLNTLLDKKDSKLVYVIDIFDLSSSLLNGLKQALIQKQEKRSVVLVINKMDLLPKSITKTMILRYIRERLIELDILRNVIYIIPISAKKEEGVKKMIEVLTKDKLNDIYLLGCTNVGKSQLMNCLLKMSRKKHAKLTTSIVPGTTMDMVKFKLSEVMKLDQQEGKSNKETYIYDTPGLFNPNQLLHYLSYREMIQVLPNKPINVKTFVWKPNTSLFFSGLARFDLIESEYPVYITIYSIVPLHMTNLKKADELTIELNGNKKNILNLPDPSDPDRESTYTLKPMIPSIEGLTIESQGIKQQAVKDICLDGLGWFSIAFWKQKNIQINAYSRNGHGISVREPIIKDTSEFKVETKVPSIVRGLQ